MSAIELFERLGIDLSPKTLIILYGGPGVGKSTLAITLAAELVKAKKYNNVLWLISEENLERESVFKLVTSYANKLGVTTSIQMRKLYKYKSSGYIRRYFKQFLEKANKSVIVLDSISAIFDWIANELGTFEALALSSRTSIASRIFAMNLKSVAINTDSIGLMVAHESVSPAEPIPRPSLAKKALHYMDYAVWMYKKGKIRKLKVTFARDAPELENNEVSFVFDKDTIRIVSE